MSYSIRFWLEQYLVISWNQNPPHLSPKTQPWFLYQGSLCTWNLVSPSDDSEQALLPSYCSIHCTFEKGLYLFTTSFSSKGCLIPSSLEYCCFFSSLTGTASILKILHAKPQNWDLLELLELHWTAETWKSQEKETPAVPLTWLRSWQSCPQYSWPLVEGK